MPSDKKNAQVPDLECVSVNKVFAECHAVKDVSFAVPAGSFFSILGPSGCGKTTLLRMIAGFQSPSSGDLLIRGKSVLDVPPNKRPVSMVFQHLALFPMMDVAANVGFGLRQRGVARAEIARRVDTVLARVGLPGVGSRRVDQLSGGQKQRVAIARCMVLEPNVLLLDEPLGALDLKLRERMKIELKNLQSEFSTTFVYITHDQSEALVMSDRIAVMNNGRFEQIGSARDLYYEPKTAFVAGFVGEANRLSATVEAVNGGAVRLRTADGRALNALGPTSELRLGEPALAFVRPEAIRLATRESDVADMENKSSGLVESILFNGANSHVILRDAQTGAEMNIAIPQTGEFRSLSRGDTVHIGWAASHTRCYTAPEAAQTSQEG